MAVRIDLCASNKKATVMPWLWWTLSILELRSDASFYEVALVFVNIAQDPQ